MAPDGTRCFIEVNGLDCLSLQDLQITGKQVLSVDLHCVAYRGYDKWLDFV